MLIFLKNISTSISNIAAGKWTANLNKFENPMLRGYLVSKTHTNKIPTAVPMFSEMTFSMAIIFTSASVAVTPEIHMADKKRGCLEDAKWKMVSWNLV